MMSDKSKSKRRPKDWAEWQEWVYRRVEKRKKWRKPKNKPQKGDNNDKK
jgi:hypothetical protein